MILNSSNNTEIVKSVQIEREKKSIEENIGNSKVIEFWANVFLKHKNVDNEIVPFPQVAPEFLIKA